MFGHTVCCRRKLTRHDLLQAIHPAIIYAGVTNHEDEGTHVLALSMACMSFTPPPLRRQVSARLLTLRLVTYCIYIYIGYSSRSWPNVLSLFGPGRLFRFALTVSDELHTHTHRRTMYRCISVQAISMRHHRGTVLMVEVHHAWLVTESANTICERHKQKKVLWSLPVDRLDVYQSRRQSLTHYENDVCPMRRLAKKKKHTFVLGVYIYRKDRNLAWLICVRYMAA